LTVPGAQSTPEDVAVTVTGLAVADVDANEGTGVIRVSLSAGSGRLTLAAGVAGGLTASQISGNGTGAVVLQGSVAAINATLAAGASYLGNVNFNGNDAITVVANDLRNTGAGGALTDTKTVTVHVLSASEQFAILRGQVASLIAQFPLNSALVNVLGKAADQVQSDLDRGKLKTAYIEIGAFRIAVQLLMLTRVLTAAQGNPLLAEADALLQGLKVGGGF
jgi:hypothetical protein